VPLPGSPTDLTVSRDGKWLAVIYTSGSNAYVAVFGIDAYGDLRPLATSSSIGVASFNGVAFSEKVFDFILARPGGDLPPGHSTFPQSPTSLSSLFPLQKTERHSSVETRRGAKRRFDIQRRRCRYNGNYRPRRLTSLYMPRLADAVSCSTGGERAQQ